MLKQANMIKRYTGGTAFSLGADANESFRVKAIFCDPNAAESKLAFQVDRTSVQTWRVVDYGGNHLAFPHDGLGGNLFTFLVDLGIAIKIPVATGQTLTVTLSNSATVLYVVYDLYDRDDVKSSEPNGTDASEWCYVDYGQNDTIIAPAATGDINNSVLGGEYPDFPFEDVVPSRYQIAILGIVASAYALGTGAAIEGWSLFLKMIRERETLFDVDKNGMLLEGDSTRTAATEDYTTVRSQIGNRTDAGVEPPLMFDPPLTFEPGSELLTQVTAGSTGTNGIAAAGMEIGYILHLKRR